MAHPHFENLLKVLITANRFGRLKNILEWDKRTNLPPTAKPQQGELMAWVIGESHKAFIDPRVGDAIATCKSILSELSYVEQLVVQRLDLCYRRATALPIEFVTRSEEVQSAAFAAWLQAKQENKFSIFQEHLGNAFDIARQEAVLLGATPGDADSLYNTLFSRYEPGMTLAELRPVLEGLRAWVVEFLQRIRETGIVRTDEALRSEFPVHMQDQIIRKLLTAIGYDFSRGNLSPTEHPFSATIGPGDHRITNHCYPDRLIPGLTGSLHEAGHSLYDQGTDPIMWLIDNSDLLLSLGIHESQSRTWENLVGRSRAFWQYALPLVRQAFPQLSHLSVGDIYSLVNIVQPSLIRIYADEATYNSHILVRLEIELALLAGTLKPADAAQAFADKMKEYVGIRPEDDLHGILQDVHWSTGAVGYFPTYTLGNLAAAQLFASFTAAVPDYQEQFARGDFGCLLAWQREHIHATGHLETLSGLLVRVTGKPLGLDDFAAYMDAKFGELYPPKAA
ncbi:MAG: carboxypeptidase M32 [Patescibacteria group bacterium]|nr:carboxypeptidase M32 [Patescibacteria group bacterium]MDD5715745.1 carboxypeptidase M32 [Patescibacteria group bacterium]